VLEIRTVSFHKSLLSISLLRALNQRIFHLLHLFRRQSFRVVTANMPGMEAICTYIDEEHTGNT
jgi:hypothetical protein